MKLPPKYEWYQILDFRGGTESTKMGNKVFPFNQYAVQNIEVPLTMHAGASETVQTALYALRSTHSASIAFIGDNGLFKLNSGSLTKAYDGKTDRMIYTIDGNAELKNLKLNLFLKFNIDSKDYVMPLTNNMTIDLNSGSKLTMNQTAALLPGVELSIAKNAELVVPNGQSMYIYDEAEWGKYCGNGNSSSTFIPVVNAPGRNGNRASLEDVKVDVNGKLTAIGGIYTTKSGANICSSEGGGRYVQQGAPGTETLTYQYDGNTNSHDIPITPAQLKNKDGSYTKTSTATASDTFTYCKCQDCGGGTWVKNLQVAAIIDSTTGKQLTTHKTLQEAVTKFLQGSSNTYIKMLHSTTENITTENVTTNRDLYLDLNGCTVTGTFDMGGHKLYGMDSSARKDYVTAPSGKIVGKVTNYATTCQSPTVKVKGVDTYDRYVAIQVTEGKTSTLSFHHFNISVTGYRFELTTGGTPKCALFFSGKFQGDDEAKKHLQSLGFTLKDGKDKSLGTVSYPIPEDKESIPKMPPEGEEIASQVVRDVNDNDAFLFEACLMGDINKENYQTQFTATAQASFDNDGTQQSDPQNLSFEDALTNQEGLKHLTDKQKEILTNFLKGLDTPNQTE